MKKVYKDIYNNERMYIIDDANIEKGRLCDTYDEFGQRVGETGAGDYSLHNDEGRSAFYDMLNEGAKIFGEAFYDAEINTVDLLLENYEYLKNAGIKACEEEITQWINNWEKKNANYTTVRHLTWWNGCNYQTHILDDEECGADLERVSGEMEAEILAAYANAENWENCEHGSRCQVGNFIFKTTIYPAFYIAQVVIA